MKDSKKCNCTKKEGFMTTSKSRLCMKCEGEIVVKPSK